VTYKNGKDFLPPRLLRELQEYIDGEIVYIPRKSEKRAGWGENNGTRLVIQKRNQDIYRQFMNGSSVRDLMSRYHLSEDSIRKIVCKMRGAAAKAAETVAQ
jgi:Mor family transcriptional regulator